MAPYSFSCTIDGLEYTTEHLGRIQFERDVHTLHEMKRLGAAPNNNGKALSHDDINALVPGEAHTVSVNTRSALGPDGARTLFKTQIQASDEMWRDIVKESAPGAAPQLARVEVTITGITLDRLRSALKPSELHTHVLRLHPDHFFAYQKDGTLYAMEIFGMYAGPLELHCFMEPDMVLPTVERLSDYPFLFAASSKLASDGTDIRTYAYHQLKPIENGIRIKVCCAFPSAAPRVLVDGHKVHMATEWWQMVEFVGNKAD